MDFFRTRNYLRLCNYHKNVNKYKENCNYKQKNNEDYKRNSLSYKTQWESLAFKKLPIKQANLIIINKE